MVLQSYSTTHLGIAAGLSCLEDDERPREANIHIAPIHSTDFSDSIPYTKALFSSVHSCRKEE